MHHIAGCFEKFTYKFTVLNENFLKSWIFDNPCLKFDRQNDNFLRKEFFEQEQFELQKNIIVSLTMSNLLNPDRGLKTQIEFENETDLHLTEVKFRILQGIARTAILTFTKLDQNEKRTDTIQNFCMRLKKGS